MTPVALRFLDQAGRTPDTVAAIDDRGTMPTYATLSQRARGLAAGLQARLGPEPGRIVAVAAKNHAEHLVALLGIFLSGQTWLPLNPRSARAMNDGIVERLSPALILCDTDCETCVSTDAETLWFEAGSPIGLNAISADAGLWQTPDLPEDHVMSVKLTGGTTGTPKAVAQTQRMIATVVDDLIDVFGIGPDDTNLAVAPLSHGAFHLLFPLLATGGRQVILSSADPAHVLDAMEQHDVTLTFMPPTLIGKLTASGLARPERFPRLRNLIYSAAPMPPAQIEKACAAFGPRIGVLYGQVEAPMTITAMTARDMQEQGKPESVGRPCPSTEVRIGDPDADGTGAILARGPLVAERYLTGEDLPRVDGWLDTGDRGFLDPDGYLHIRGRAREMLITGGFNIYPVEVERVLAALEGVQDVCVFGVADAYWGERVEAAVVADAGLTDEALAAAVREAIGPVAVPKRWHRTDSLPRNAVGKTVRREVAARFSDEAA
ncbi:MAG: AMP-binding protein [Pseudomonadota bacterium]|nr:AMP-binding protein [Pseudomonadota bacterium]